MGDHWLPLINWRDEKPPIQAASMLLVKLKIDDPVDACGTAVVFFKR
jgi:hypothetical protein